MVASDIVLDTMGALLGAVGVATPLLTHLLDVLDSPLFIAPSV